MGLWPKVVWRQTYRCLSIPTTRMVLAPYRRVGLLTREQTNYKIALPSTTVAIERTYGVLERRFKQLQHINEASVMKNNDLRRIMTPAVY